VTAFQIKILTLGFHDENNVAPLGMEERGFNKR